MRLDVNATIGNQQHGSPDVEELGVTCANMFGNRAPSGLKGGRCCGTPLLFVAK